MSFVFDPLFCLDCFVLLHSIVVRRYTTSDTPEDDRGNNKGTVIAVETRPVSPTLWAFDRERNVGESEGEGNEGQKYNGAI
jgi:hypothetical protein